MSGSFACTVCKHGEICFRVLHLLKTCDRCANKHEAGLLAGLEEGADSLEKPQWTNGVDIDKVLDFLRFDLGQIPIHGTIACVCYDHIQPLDFMLRGSEECDGILGVCVGYSIDLNSDELAVFTARKFTQGLARRVIRAPYRSDNGSVGLREEASSESSSETWTTEGEPQTSQPRTRAFSRAIRLTSVCPSDQDRLGGACGSHVD